MAKSFNSDKILVVGAGLAGCTIARILAENNFKVNIIEKRNHVAGNIYDCVNKYKERIHLYGPHLLHCDKDSPALAFLSRFTKWIKYEHKVRALLENGKTTPLPINQTTIEDIYDVKFNTQSEVKAFLEKISDKKSIPTNTDEFFEYNLGNKLTDIFFRPYTRKMWGIDPKELSLNIGSRLPIRTSKDERYFDDNFQALPLNGYTHLIENMLDHQNIKVELKRNFSKKMEKDFFHSFLCIPIDNYFSYKYGVLPYRSILFHSKREKINLDAPVVNFTDKEKYTRKTQWNLFPNSEGINNLYNTITYEEPCSMKRNPYEYYYPVQTKNSNLVFQKYKLLSKSKKNITFCGRTGLFKYIDMIPAVMIHMKIAQNFVTNSESA